MYDKLRDEYNYEIYIYSEPLLMLLENESIIDVNLKEIAGSKFFELEYSDDFFDFNLKNSSKIEFSITIIVNNSKGRFLQQIELQGENPHFDDNFFRVEYEQITNNSAWNSINPRYKDASEVYKRQRVSYLRNKKIDTLLS